MLITLKILLRTLVLPPAGPLLVAVVGAWLAGRADARRLRRAGWGLLIAGLASLWVLATPRVADALTRVAQRCPALNLARALEAQAVVILGGEDERLGAPEYGGEPAAGQMLLERLDYGAYVARRTALPVLVSGTPNETGAMRAVLSRDFGIATRWIENRSRDTFQNAQFSARLLRPLGVTRIVLVTDADHEYRALREFASAGFEVVPAPVGLYVPHGPWPFGYVPTATALARSTRALYELLGNVARVTFTDLDVRRQQP